MQFNGGTDQPQVRTASEAEDGAASSDPGEKALPACLRYQRLARAERAGT